MGFMRDFFAWVGSIGTSISEAVGGVLDTVNSVVGMVGDWTSTVSSWFASIPGLG
ncbi:hypothetical protein ODZ83_02310 [Acaricomes phytoseiuli]|uniref:hypothetical protein n=1 Tax=Acaricomes phytoseiuli TaxID=291968 RepID=UPI00036F6F1E|nr:hypothetical protein [Acaricomes phytoseiuli]MCW1249037.1 hypothetical protein [Acaricomes phytoseiuli]